MIEFDANGNPLDHKSVPLTEENQIGKREIPTGIYTVHKFLFRAQWYIAEVFTTHVVYHKLTAV